MYRQIHIKPSAGKQAAIVIALPDKTNTLPAGYAALDKTLGGALAATIKRPEFSAAKGTLTTLPPAATRGAAPTYILGLGQSSADHAEALRVGAARLLRAAHAAQVPALAVTLLPGLGDDADHARAGRSFGDGLAIAHFTFDQYKGLAAPAGKALDLTVALDKPLADPVRRGLSVGQSANVARQLAATPPNIANPAYLVNFTRKLAKAAGLKHSVIDAKAAAKLGMGGLLAVGGAGSTPPAVITLEHKPAAAKGKPILLVGKAVTFDTGGYSLKPADSMDRMKYDKSGGMAVIGAMHAVAALKLPLHVVGVVPAAENLVSDKAYRPGDIVRFINGVTSEITNTDAEGRVILADALAYATRKHQPQAVIDLATLTGGVVVALGSHMAGLFANDDALRDRLLAAGQFTGERLWHLPLWEEHRQQMKGVHGDLVNAGPREASPILGAAFLSYFIEPDGRQGLPTLPWAHLDIAGVADMKAERGPFPIGPTGFGVRLLIHALENWR